MGNKTLCCTKSAQFGSTITKHRGPKSIAVSSFLGCNVSLSFGHLFDEDVDTVVVVANTKLKLGPKTKEYLKKHGGATVQLEIEQTLLEEGGRLELGSAAYTHAGEMDYDYIFYAILPSCCDNSMFFPKVSFTFDNNTEYQLSASYQENMRIQDGGLNIYTDKLLDSEQTHERQNIYECVVNCLSKASELGVNSIAFPLLEPLHIHITKSKLIATMLSAIKFFLKENHRSSLSDIRITTQDAQTMSLCKCYLSQIIGSEGTLQNSLPSSQQGSDLHVDEILKFCHTSKNVTDEIKNVKSSF